MSLIKETIFDGGILTDSHRKRTDHMAYLPDMEILDSTVGAEVLARTSQYDPSRVTEGDVRRALSKKNRDPEDFGALLSPAALPLLEEIAQEAMRETREHFGSSISMFTPVYIANYCENYCIYCGFNTHNKIRRAQLDFQQIETELAAIHETGL